ncbi:MAG: DUF374 domain-containing protein [Planctomycetota bacterium]
MSQPLPLSTRLLGLLIALLVHLLAATWRYRVRGLQSLAGLQAARLGGVVLLLHSRIPVVAHYFGRPQWRPVGMLASRSRDGDLVTAVLGWLGYDAVRGSSSRGGAQALVQMQRYLRDRRDRLLGITVDGPRGPRGHCKPGGLQVSLRAGTPLVLVAAAADRAWYARSWDRMCIPKPGARITFLVLPPIRLPAVTEANRRRIEELLLHAHHRCLHSRRNKRMVA